PQPAHEPVVLAVPDQRLVADVVREGVPVELLGEVAVPRAGVVGDLGEVLPVGRRRDRGLVEFGLSAHRCTVSGGYDRQPAFPRTRPTPAAGTWPLPGRGPWPRGRRTGWHRRARTTASA